MAALAPKVVEFGVIRLVGRNILGSDAQGVAVMLAHVSSRRLFVFRAVADGDAEGACAGSEVVLRVALVSWDAAHADTLFWGIAAEACREAKLL